MGKTSRLLPEVWYPTNDFYHSPSKMLRFSNLRYSIDSRPSWLCALCSGVRDFNARIAMQIPADLGVAKRRHNFTSARPLSSSRLSSSHGNAFAQDSEYQKALKILDKVRKASNVVASSWPSADELGPCSKESSPQRSFAVDHGKWYGIADSIAIIRLGVKIRCRMLWRYGC